ncbi:SGNH/GDSL hydrolase family protein [Stappia sp. GBMRC 2046]|uniref:SGNH/GDSL hydrolase family protein n=1 Tax=Stappia sediminis TaxID=2692190 RepID=A0A7X3S8M0_9HYPH|nr:SGNH/GDSL hydrolase family protein [Stappia sediminis]MXN65957.1 SGNH/GDSL hydrolase family protein [Stappia sediminis]
MIASFVSWAAFPVYALEGIRTRVRSLRLPPGEGPTSGNVEGEGEPLHLLVLGDSSAAAVGIARQADGLAPALARALNEKTGRPVAWRGAGFNSATSDQLRDHVVHNLEPAPYTHILFCVGFNDVKNFHSGRRFKKGFGGLLYALKARFPDSRLYWSQVLDPNEMPLISSTLGAILKLRADLFNRVGSRLCLERGAIDVPAMKGLSADAFCSDGVHPSETGFEAWARHLTQFIDQDASRPLRP